MIPFSTYDWITFWGAVTTIYLNVEFIYGEFLIGLAEVAHLFESGGVASVEARLSRALGLSPKCSSFYIANWVFSKRRNLPQKKCEEYLLNADKLNSKSYIELYKLGKRVKAYNDFHFAYIVFLSAWDLMAKHGDEDSIAFYKNPTIFELVFLSRVKFFHFKFLISPWCNVFYGCSMVFLPFLYFLFEYILPVSFFYKFIGPVIFILFCIFMFIGLMDLLFIVIYSSRFLLKKSSKVVGVE
jgi:hypothetical protein